MTTREAWDQAAQAVFDKGFTRAEASSATTAILGPRPKPDFPEPLTLPRATAIPETTLRIKGSERVIRISSRAEGRAHFNYIRFESLEDVICWLKGVQEVHRDNQGSYSAG